MVKEKIELLDDLTLDLHFNLSILNSAIKDDDKLELYVLEDFVKKIYENSIAIRELFEN